MTSSGVPSLVGTDLNDGSPIAAQPDPTQVYNFMLLDPDLLTCDFFAFNTLSRDQVEGVQFTILQTADGLCGGVVDPIPHVMVGFRDDSRSAERSSGTRAEERGKLGGNEMVTTGDAGGTALDEGHGAFWSNSDAPCANERRRPVGLPPSFGREDPALSCRASATACGRAQRSDGEAAGQLGEAGGPGAAPGLPRWRCLRMTHGVV